MMTGIPIQIGGPTAKGRLYPRYHNSSGILSLGSDEPRPWPFGITIDGLLILDFDGSGLLAGVELLLPMWRWKGKLATSPPDGAAGDIMLPEPRLTSTEYDWPVTVSKDVQTDAARIDFGGGYDRAVRLSEACSALLAGDRLTGFWFTLAR
jgi:hypothetical protein